MKKKGGKWSIKLVKELKQEKNLVYTNWKISSQKWKICTLKYYS